MKTIVLLALVGFLFYVTMPVPEPLDELNNRIQELNCNNIPDSAYGVKQTCEEERRALVARRDKLLK